MKGTLISILVGALAGVLLTVGSSVHAAHVAASHAKHSADLVVPAEVAPNPASDPAVPATPPSDKAQVRK
jgi:hypothetical protein